MNTELCEVVEIIEDYKVVEAKSAKELRTKVLAQLDNDYEPQGGVSIAPYVKDGELVVLYCQAMVLLGEEEEDGGSDE